MRTPAPPPAARSARVPVPVARLDHPPRYLLYLPGAVMAACRCHFGRRVDHHEVTGAGRPS
jgi:hypothetical protein